MIHFRDLLRGTKLFPRIELITNDSQENFLRELGKNDFYHSQNIEKIIDSLIPDNIKQDKNIFDLGEIFLLIVSIYLHDIGRKTDPTHHEIESYKQIRTYPNLFHLNEFEASAVAQICAAHAPENEWPISRNDPNYGIMDLMYSGRTCNLQRLGALLRLGDELDNTYIRTRGIIGQEKSIRNSIRCISPNFDTGYIEIQSEPKSWSEFETLQIVREYTQKRLNEIIPYLKEMSLPYYQIWLSPNNFKAPMKTDFSSKPIDTLVNKIINYFENHYTQVDIYEQIDGIELPIVCRNKNFGIEEVTGILVTDKLTYEQTLEFSGVLNNLLKKRAIDIAIVISNTNIDKGNKKIFIDKGIKSVTFEELFYNLFHFDNYINKNIKLYEESEIYKRKLYIKSSATSSTNEMIPNFEDYILNWVENGEGVQQTIIGDFGIGKTTLLQKINYECAKKTSTNKSYRIPIYVKLKELSSFSSIESLITSNLSINVKIDIETFHLLNKAGRFVIFLDGFDEIPDLHNEDNVLLSFRDIDKIVEPNSKVILSCRTHFFKSNEQMINAQEGTKLFDQIKNKSGYKLYNIENFNRTQISSYIKKWAGKDSELYLNTIDSIYNLADLANRPVLLNLIVKTIPQLHKIDDSIINSCSLYKTYVRYWLDRDDWRTIMAIEDRSIISKELSRYFLVNDIRSIHFTNLDKIFSGSIKSKMKYKSEILDYELRTCNFLRRDSTGNYSFVHNSFQEYFLAVLFVEKFLDVKHDLPNWYLNIEKQRNKKGIIKTTKETDFFFFQAMELEIHNSNNIEELFIDLSEDTRKTNLIIHVIEELNLLSFGKLLMKILINLGWSADIEKLIHRIQISFDIEISFAYLESLIDKNSDFSFINYVIDNFEKGLTSDTDVIIHTIRKKIKKIESKKKIKHEDFSEFIAYNNYPFSKEKYKIELEKNLKSDEPIDKSYFDRQWKRGKAEYDQKVRRNKNK